MSWLGDGLLRPIAGTSHRYERRRTRRALTATRSAGLRAESPESQSDDAGPPWTLPRPAPTNDGRGRLGGLPGAPATCQACAKTLVPTMPTTVSAMKQAWMPLTLSPNRMTPPMITPIAPAPVQIA